MKLFIYIISILANFIYSGVEQSDEIVAALKQGKASELIKYFEEKVSVKIINQEDVLSKSQAEANLKYFFSKHNVKSFSSSHVSSMNNQSQYITGTLETTAGKFRVSILIKHNLITQFRIENEDD